MSSHYKVMGKLDTSHPQEGTVTIDRAAGLLHVRPKHRRRVYTLPLGKVAEMVCCRVIKAEVFEARLSRKGKRGR